MEYLTWKFFWKVFPYLAGAIALIGAVWYIDHRGYSRAEAEATARDNERKLMLAEFNAAMALKVEELEGKMQMLITESDARVTERMTALDTVNRTIIQPTLEREIRNEVRFTDPAAGITDSMREELNRARGFSEQRPCPAGSNAVACFALPDALAAGGQ